MAQTQPEPLNDEEYLEAQLTKKEFEDELTAWMLLNVGSAPF